ncbi:MAG: twin-arginine translocase TatA/TatE family subunit [Actinomycetota bacterium]
MFDINGGEFLVLGAVAVVVLGPERLPTYAAQLGKLVREARTFARNAREQVRGEMGEEFDDIDWQKLDPRRYDPRRIVRDALLDDDDAPSGVSDRAPHVPAAMRPADEPADAVDVPADAPTPRSRLSSDAPITPVTPAAAPSPAPTYDLDAT